ncbi:hypothetical protein I3843_02G043900 [Carya illinoinensis]|nr:hypothetical protein I3843_02G043900 [Carya illinoinensis]
MKRERESLTVDAQKSRKTTNTQHSNLTKISRMGNTYLNAPCSALAGYSTESGLGPLAKCYSVPLLKMTTNLLATPIWHLRKEFASFRLSTYNPFPGGKGFLVSPLPLPFLHSVATIYLCQYQEILYQEK